MRQCARCADGRKSREAVSDRLLDLFTNTVAKDLCGLMAGDQVGYGMSRDVRVFLPDPEYVLKFELDSGRFQNVMEWEFWQEVRDMNWFNQWFAPCRMISACGTILMMRRTYAPKIPYPEKIPSFITDTKLSNFGQLEDRIVCHDYGRLLMTNYLTRRTKKAKWWREDA